jgi:hypothetical protein
MQVLSARMQQGSPWEHHYLYQQEEPEDNSAETMVSNQEVNISNFFTKKV